MLPSKRKQIRYQLYQPHHGKHSLIDFYEFSEQNNGFARTFSKPLITIPMKSKKATTVALQQTLLYVSCQILISSLSFSIIVLFYLLLTRKFTLTLDVVCYWYYMCMMADKTPFKDILWVGYDQLCPIQHMRIRK